MSECENCDFLRTITVTLQEVATERKARIYELEMQAKKLSHDVSAKQSQVDYLTGQVRTLQDELSAAKQGQPVKKGEE